MAALDARGIKEARVVADQRAAREHQLGQRLQPAGRDRACAVADSLSLLEKTADRRMRLEALEFLIGREIRVLVAEPDHKADRHLAVLHVIEERAAIGARVQRPAGRMHDQSWLVPLGLHLPELFQPDAVDLRIGALAQPIARLELLAEMPA